MKTSHFDFPFVKIYDPRGEVVLTETVFPEYFSLYVLGQRVLTQLVILPQEIYQLSEDERQRRVGDWLEYWESECISSMVEL